MLTPAHHELNGPLYLETSEGAVAVNTSAAALRENRKAIYQDAEFAEIYFKTLSTPESLSEIEFHRFRILMKIVIDGLWDIHSRTAVAGASILADLYPHFTGVCPLNRLNQHGSRSRQNHALRQGFVQSVHPTRKLVTTASKGMSKRALKQSEIFTPFQQ